MHWLVLMLMAFVVLGLTRKYLGMLDFMPASLRKLK
jgi:hypothetical protein